MGKFQIILLDDLMDHIVNSIETQNLFTKFCIIKYNSNFAYSKCWAQGPCSRIVVHNSICKQTRE